MKKVILAGLIITAVLMTGCGKKDKNPYVTQNVDIPAGKTGNIFLLKYNTSTNQIIRSGDTGYIVGAQSRNAADNEEVLNDSFIPSKKFNNAAQQMNDNFMKAFKEAPKVTARAANENPIVSGKNTEIASKTKFWSYTSKNNSSDFMDGKMTEINVSEPIVGDHCYIFVDTKATTITSQMVTDLKEKFDDCYELETAIMGDPIYSKYNSTYFVPCGDKISIVVSDLYGDGDKGDIMGYFYSGDLFNKKYLEDNKQHYGDIKSNECEVFYVDSYYLKESPEEMYSTLVHEFNHMINFVVKTLNYLTKYPDKANSAPSCSSWFTEMLSMTTEDMFAKYLFGDDYYIHSPQARLPYFNLYHNYGFINWNNPYTVGTVKDGKYVYLTGADYTTMYAFVNYANTYAFGAYLARNYGGINLIKEIAQSEYVDDVAITKALQKVYKSSSNFESVVEDFPMCLVTTKEATSASDTFITLNREVKASEDAVLYFTKINLDTVYVEYEENKTKKKQTVTPRIYTQSDYSINPDLGPLGFSIHWAGKNISSFTFAKRTTTPIDYWTIY